MIDFIGKQKLAANKDGAGGGSPPPADPPAPPPTDPPKPAAEPPGASNPPPAKTEGDNLDDFGYVKDPAPGEKPPEKKAGDPPKEGDKSKETPPAKIADIKDPGTGYGEEPPKVDDPPPADPKDPPAAPDEIDKVLEGLPKEEIAKMRDFVTKHETKTVKEALKEFAEIRRQEYADAKKSVERRQAQIEQEKNQTRAQWHKELKDDPGFGGEKFQINVTRAEKVLSEYMPQTKKALTERKSMLPPYVMRDLAAMADHLYPEQKLVQGDPPPPPAQEAKGTDDALAYYT